MVEIRNKKCMCILTLLAVCMTICSMDAPELSTRFVTISYTYNDICLHKTIVLPGDIKTLGVDDTSKAISAVKKQYEALRSQGAPDFSEKGELVTLLQLLEKHRKLLLKDSAS